MLPGRGTRRYASIAATLCLALGFGLNYGSSNQAVYLLGSARLLQPDLWQRDWLANTHHYHPAYALLGALLLKLEPSGWLIALANMAAIGAGVWCMQRLLRLLASERDRFCALIIVLALAAATRTRGIGGSYVFNDIFQPSTLGSLGLLGAAVAFVAGRPLVSGLCLAAGGVFHLNHLLLGLSVFGVAWLLGERQDRWRRGLFLLGPALLVLACFLPLLRATDAPGLTAEARRIYQEVRAPHHYRLATFARDLLPWLGFQLLGAAAAWSSFHSGSAPHRRLLCVLAGFWTLIIPAALLAGFATLRAVDQLFAWRVSAHSDLLAQAALASALAPALLGTAAGARLGRPQLIAGALGLALLLLSVALGADRTAPLLTVLFTVLGTFALRWRRLAVDVPRRMPPGALLDSLLIASFLGANFTPLARVSESSSLLSGKDHDLDQLCSWLDAHTPKAALLLTPPDEDEIRFRCQRAIVVDWKATPVLPAEVLEWRARVQNVTGRHPLQSDRDLAGYGSLDAGRVERLRQRYGFDVVIVKRGAALELGAAPDFAGGRFFAYRLQPVGAASSGTARVPAQ